MSLVTCTPEFKDQFKCPTKEEYLIQLCNLLPHGRAWQSHDSSSSAHVDDYRDIAAQFGTVQFGAAEVGLEPIYVARSGLTHYWGAYAEINAYFAERACKLLDEFFCQTIDETRDWWSIDYGFPDPCDPWDDLCEKVAALGGSTCAFIKWAAGTRGWLVDCIDCSDTPAIGPEADCAWADCDAVCEYDCPHDTLYITISLSDSVAYIAPLSPPFADCAMADCTELCDPGYEQIQCLIERVKPAHVLAVYSTM